MMSIENKDYISFKNVSLDTILNNGQIYNTKDIRRKLNKKLNNNHGIYCFIDEFGNPLYVGKSINLRLRLIQHLDGRCKPTKYLLQIIKYVRIYVFQYTGGNLIETEKFFISTIKPLFNGAINCVEKTYNYSNLRRGLDSFIRIKDGNLTASDVEVIKKNIHNSISIIKPINMLVDCKIKEVIEC